MESTKKLGAEASARNQVTGVVKKANSESYRIPKKINRLITISLIPFRYSTIIK
jgi:hypothetical protein